MATREDGHPAAVKLLAHPALRLAFAPVPALRVPVRAARRLAILAQRLAGPAPRGRPDAAAVRAVAEALGCLQLDPISAVARSQLLVLHSRLGDVDPGLLDRLAYEERALFEYWAHEASYVCAVDLPLHAWAMGTWPRGDTLRSRRALAWLDANAAFRDHVLERLTADGPLRARDIENRAAVAFHFDGWTPQEFSVGRMLELLWMGGEIGVWRREGGQRLWALSERCLPAPGVQAAQGLEERDVVRLAAQRSLRALGVARLPHVRAHFTRNRYPGLAEVFAGLHAEGTVERVAVDGRPGAWWVHAADVETLRELAAEELPWRGRTALLSPFDNLVCDRARTELLFGFHHRLEIYVPAAKRRWGYLVLPILHGDSLIGRADLAVDSRAGVLEVKSLYREAGAPQGAAVGRAVRRRLDALARWRGVLEVRFTGPVPAEWRAGLLEPASVP